MTRSPIVDREWAYRYAVPLAIRNRLRELETLVRDARDEIRTRLRDLPGDKKLTEVLRLLDRFLGDAETGALAAALRRETEELREGAVGRRIIENAWATLERAVRRVIEADDLRRDLRFRVVAARSRLESTVAWHFAEALAEWKLDQLDRVTSSAAVRRGSAGLDLIEARLDRFSREVSGVPVRILEQSGWPAGVSAAELAHAASLKDDRVAEHPGLRRREQLRAATAAHTSALLGPAGPGLLDRTYERMADELLRVIDPVGGMPDADIDASAILLRGAARMRSMGRIVDPVANARVTRATTAIGVTPLFGSFVLLKKGLVSPVRVVGERATCGTTVGCVVVGEPGVPISRPIREWGTPLFDHPPETTLEAVATGRVARVRVFARLEATTWIGQLVERGELRDVTNEPSPPPDRVTLLCERRDLRAESILPTRSVGAAPTFLCGIKREEVEVPVRDRPRVVRQSALTGDAFDLLDSEWQFLLDARRRTKVILPRPVGTDAQTEAFLYEIPEGLSLAFSGSVRQLREKDPMQLTVAVAVLWRALHEDSLLQRRPNSLALGLYHEQTIQFRPFIGVERDGLLAVVVAAPCAVFTDMPYPTVPESARGLPRFTRLGGPPVTRWLARWGIASPGRDGFAAILFMLEMLAARPLQLAPDLTWSDFVETLAERAAADEWFQDPDKAAELIDALRFSESRVVTFLRDWASKG